MKNVEGIILAAGFSERMGKFKMELPLGNKTLLERCIDGMASVCDRIIVIGGYKYEKIKQITSGIPKVESVYNEKFETGMFTSVQRGIREIKAERFFIIPGDQPLVKAETYRKLLKIDAEIVIPRYKGKKGHPVLIRSYFIGEISAMPEDACLRDFIRQKQSFCIDVDDRGVLLDVDDLKDYKSIKEFYEKELP